MAAFGRPFFVRRPVSLGFGTSDGAGACDPVGTPEPGVQASGGGTAVPCVDEGMDGRTYHAIAMGQGGLEPADASALHACYNLPLPRVPGLGNALFVPVGPPAGAGTLESTGAAGPRHALEPSTRRRNAELPESPRVNPLARMTPPPPVPDETAGQDGSEFNRFLREHRAPLVAFLGRRVGEDDAQDVAQETFMRLMRYHAQPADQLRPLMYRIAINVIHDRGRRDSTRQAGLHVSMDEDFAALPSAEPSQDMRIEREQELELVRQVILQLPTRCRQVYLLNRIEGLSYSQIAQHCDISVKAVEKHIGKALALLRQKLKEGGLDREERS